MYKAAVIKKSLPHKASFRQKDNIERGFFTGVLMLSFCNIFCRFVNENRSPNSQEGAKILNTKKDTVDCRERENHNGDILINVENAESLQYGLCQCQHSAVFALENERWLHAREAHSDTGEAGLDMKSMNKAMAFFLRTRRLDIRRLDRKPQENLGVVHKILAASVKDVLENVKKLERGFYGQGKTAQDDITKYMPCVLVILQASHISHLNSLVAINDIIQRSQDPKINFSVDPFQLNKLKECLRKISDVIPAKFTEMVLDLKRILKYLDKYCLSFYDLEGHVYLDTGHYYEKQRRFFRSEIKRYLDKVDILYEKFRKSVLIHSEMSSYARDLARKTDCQRAPFLLLFPESCECIRTACSACMSWIDADSNYATFISNDINNLELKKEEVSKVLRTCQEKFHQLHFRWTEVKKDYQKVYGEIGKLYDREDELLVEEECLVNETNEVQVEIEQKEYRREALLKNMNNMCEELLYEKYSEISDSLRELKMRLPFIQRALANVRYKLTWIGEQKVKLKASYKEFTDVQDEMERENQMKMEKDIELNAIMETLDLARQIHLYKSTPDAMEKIFYEQPVLVNNTRLPGMRGKDDPFERACAVVYEELRDDWAALYRCLPWHPPRGEVTLDREIEEFAVSASRIGSKDTARRVLHRWRRFHTRAKLEDLKEGLCLAKRPDIIEKIEQQLNPPEAEETPPEEPVNSFLEPDLLPYLKEVERFDELRASGKL